MNPKTKKALKVTGVILVICLMIGTASILKVDEPYTPPDTDLHYVPTTYSVEIIENGTHLMPIADCDMYAIYITNSTEWVNYSIRIERTGSRNYRNCGLIEVEKIGTFVIDNCTYSMIAKQPDGSHYISIDSDSYSFDRQCIIDFDSAGVNWYNISMKLNPKCVENLVFWDSSFIYFRISLSDYDYNAHIDNDVNLLFWKVNE